MTPWNTRVGTLLLALALAGCNDSTPPAPPGNAGTEAHAEDDKDHDHHEEHHGEAGHTEEQAHAEAGHGEAHEQEGQHDHPAAEGEQHATEQLVLTPAQQQAAGLQLSRAGPEALRLSRTLRGEVRTAPNGELSLRSPLAGVVVEARGVPGQAVRQGELLAVIESGELADASRQYLEARSQQRLAEDTFKREAGLWAERITAEQDYLAARAGQEQARIALASARAKLLALGSSEQSLDRLDWQQAGSLARLELRAPHDAVIISRSAGAGQRVSADTGLITLAQLDRVMASLAATPAELQGLRPGLPLQLKAVDGQQRGQSTIDALSPTIDESTRTAGVYASLDNRDGQWRPGQFVSAEVEVAARQVPVAVANAALQTVEEQSVVFVRQGEGFQPRPVQLGQRDAQHTEILAGLSAGEEYVAGNSFLLKAEMGKSQAEHQH